MAVIGKLIVCLFVFVAAYLFSFWLVFIQILPLSLSWLATAGSLLTGLALAVLVWRWLSNPSPGILGTAAIWAAIAGAIGFFGGFFGPMVLAPDANQGPLLGLFITGPVGVVGGGLCGLIYGIRRRSAGSAG